MSATEIRSLCDQWLSRSSLRDPARLRNARICNAFTHPFNLLIAGWMVVLALSTAPWILPLLLVGCELMILLLLRVPCITSHLDVETARAERLRAHEARAKLMCEMSEEHQAEIERLELLVASIRAGEGDPRAAQSGFDPYPYLERLLACYAELAIAYREARRRLALTDCASAFSEISERRGERSATSGSDAPRAVDDAGRLRRLEELRLRIGRRRAQYYWTNRQRLAAMRAELAMIAELVELAHELSMLPSGMRALLDEGEWSLDRVIADVDGFCQGMHELSEEPRQLRDAGDALRGGDEVSHARAVSGAVTT